MWIQTQNRQMLINSNQIIDIFIDETGTKILADTIKSNANEETGYIILGEYENKTVCYKVFVELLTISLVRYTYEDMPLRTEVAVNGWILHHKRNATIQSTDIVEEIDY